ncbi:MAG: GDP-L-fucose synthase, partial [Bdellovibrionales bacterium]|nr:GDP-L-fucose synthase [Bdellovibrionales bacterium]
MDLQSNIFVAGHRGLVGSAIVRALKQRGYRNIITIPRDALDLTDQSSVEHFFSLHQIEYVIIAAAKVGGILFNQSHQADFLYENLMINTNIIKAAADHEVAKLLLLGSSCIYPKFSSQPISENSLLKGPLEPTNEGYAIAKIAGLKLCEKYHEQYNKCFISAMPTNLYGPGDNFHPTHSHVIPGMMRRFHDAKYRGDESVTIWGSGNPRREFLHVDDLAEAVIHLMLCYNDSQPINVGTGKDMSILDLATVMAETVGYQGAILTDPSKPD